MQTVAFAESGKLLGLCPELRVYMLTEENVLFHCTHLCHHHHSLDKLGALIIVHVATKGHKEYLMNHLNICEIHVAEFKNSFRFLIMQKSTISSRFLVFNTTRSTHPTRISRAYDMAM